MLRTRFVALAAVLPLVVSGISSAQPAEDFPADTRYLTGGEVCDPFLPALVTLPGGGFAAAWIDGQVHTSVFGRHAERVGPETLHGTPDRFPTDPHLAVSPSGRIAVGWLEDDGPHVQILQPNGLPLTDDLALGGPAPGFHPDPQAEYEIPQVFDLVADPAGGFLALWVSLGTHGARIGEDGQVQRFDPPPGHLLLSPTSFQAVLHPDGELWWIENQDPPITPAITFLRVARSRLEGPGAFEPEEVFAPVAGTQVRRQAIAVDGRGRVVAAWSRLGGISVQRFAASGERIGETLTVTVEDLEELALDRLYSLDLAVDAEGNFAVVWGRQVSEAPLSSNTRSTLFVRGFGADGSPFGPAREVVSVPFDRLLSPRVAFSGPGKVTVAWWTETGGLFPGIPPECPLSEAIFARQTSLAGDSNLLLGNGRFRVDVAWQDPFNGGAGVGHAIPDTPDSGGFWFFDPDNTELKVKVIDGRPVNGRFWFFYGALSNVEYHITVTDQRTGFSRTYDNAPGVFASFADTFAFPGTD